MNILIADDSKMIRHMVIIALNELGYKDISEASDVAEAKNLLKGKKFDLVISDWHMPGESGLDFLKYVKSCPEYANMPFVLQTTENEKKNIVEAVKSGVSGYLFKPVQKSALAQKMQELSIVYKFPPPVMNMPVISFPVKNPAVKKETVPIVLQSETGLSARTLSEFSSELAKQEYGFSCEIKSGSPQAFQAHLAHDLYKQLPKVLKDRFADASYIVMCDSETEKKYKTAVDAIVKETGGFKISIPDMENNRTVSQYSAIIDLLAANETGLPAVLVAFGDMPLLSVAGFVAATYCGGIPLVVIPLTLKTFLDVGIGGTWILNGVKGKKAAGLGYDPVVVWFDTTSLAGLPDIDYSYSCAEFFRYAFFGGKELMETITAKWDVLIKKDAGTIADFARLCIAARASICMQSIESATKNALLLFAQSLADTLVSSCAKGELDPGQALYRAITCICEIAKQEGTLAQQSFGAYVNLLQKMPVFKMPEVKNPATIFSKAFGPLSQDFGRASVAFPYTAGTVLISQEIPEKTCNEVFKSLLIASGDADGKKK